MASGRPFPINFKCKVQGLCLWPFSQTEQVLLLPVLDKNVEKTRMEKILRNHLQNALCFLSFLPPSTAHSLKSEFTAILLMIQEAVTFFPRKIMSHQRKA